MKFDIGLRNITVCPLCFLTSSNDYKATLVFIFKLLYPHCNLIHMATLSFSHESSQSIFQEDIGENTIGGDYDYYSNQPRKVSR